MNDSKYKHRKFSILIVQDVGVMPEIVFDCGIFADGEKTVTINNGQTGALSNEEILAAIGDFLIDAS